MATQKGKFMVLKENYGHYKNRYGLFCHFKNCYFLRRMPFLNLFYNYRLSDR